MLTALRQADGRKVQAGHSHRLHGPFQCPGCGRPALLVKGTVRVHHFRHQAEPGDCLRSLGESALHRDCKQAIFCALQAAEGVAGVELEKDIGSNVADVFALIRGVPVAVEIQRSELPIEVLERRTLTYHAQQVHVLWVALAGEEIAFTPYSPRAWERWCHATYGGRVYYWTQGDVLQPVHFDAHWLHTPEFTTRDAQGQPMTVGGQMRHSKRYRAPNHGQRVSISSSFRPVVRRERSGGTLHVPRCSLYVDCQLAWWKPGEQTA